jgi:hypothetical protein
MITVPPTPTWSPPSVRHSARTEISCRRQPLEAALGPYAALEAEFHQACEAAIEACRYLNPPYRPTAWQK